MTRAAQSLVLAGLGGVAVRIGVTDEYARYINDWMRWPLVVSGVLLVGLAVVAGLSTVLGSDHHPGARVAWLLVLPVVVGFVVQPPALGSYVADRRANAVDASLYAESGGDLDPTGVNDLPVSEFVARAAIDEGSSLAGVPVRLVGFVSTDEDGWYVSRLTIACCAADAAAFRVRVDGQVDGQPAPPAEQWVEVVGTWVDGTGSGSGGTPAVTATEVVLTDEPDRPYE